MIVVVDVSAAIEILLQKEKKGPFQESCASASLVVAPDLYVSELAKVFWKLCKAKAVTHAQCIQHAEDGIALIDDFIDAEELWKESLAEGIKNAHSVYDMFYMVLARRNDATLLTRDDRLAEICRKQKISVLR